MELEVDEHGSAYVAGSFSGTATFGDRTLTAHGLRDAFFARIDGEGRRVRWLLQPSAGVFVTGDEVALGAGRISYLGRFAGSTAFGAGTLTSAGRTDWLALRLPSRTPRVEP